MNRKKIFKWIAILAVVGLIAGGSITLYMFNMPHRDVQSSKVDYSLQASELVNEFLSDTHAANAKYLDDEGESKIVQVSGIVSEISRDMNNQVVLLLKAENDKAGVSATFMETTNEHAEKLSVGSKVVIKGVIRSGANYDEDLEFYEDVIIEKSDIVQ